MLRLPSTNSRIWSIVSRSMFCMVIFIHPQLCILFHRSRSGSFRIGNNLPLQARPALETNHRFRLIPHWIILTLASALTILREVSIPIVVCECDLAPGTWKELLAQLALLPNSPFLIVTSLLADEHLWAEALSLGAYDVLAKPFDRKEVIRIFSLAWLHWHDRHEIPTSAMNLLKLASGM